VSSYAAPRRRVRRRVGPSRIRWDRLGRTVLVLVLFGVLISYLNPVVNLIDAWRDSKAGEDRLVELEREQASLEEKVEEASSPLTVEREARRLGMIRAGERAYVVRGLGD
jgi:cell division protein FtsB